MRGLSLAFKTLTVEHSDWRIFLSDRTGNACFLLCPAGYHPVAMIQAAVIAHSYAPGII